MSKKILINGFWIAIASLTFFLGKEIGNPSNEHHSKTQVKPTPSQRTSTTQNSPRSNAASSRREIKEEFDSLSTNFLDQTDPLKRQLAFTALLSSLTKENIKAIVQAHRESSSEPSRKWEETKLLMYAWGKLDGKAAILFAEELVQKRERSAAYLIIAGLEGWSSKDPRSALGWVNAVEEPGFRGKFGEGVLPALVKQDLAAATDFMLSFSEDDQNRDHLRIILDHQLKEGTDTASRWVEGLPPGEMKREGIRKVAENFTGNDPTAASRWAESYLDKEMATHVISKVAEEWAEKDPAVATEWVLTLPEGEAKNQGIRDAIRGWVRHDYVAAGEFVAQLQPGLVRDSAVSRYATEVVPADPLIAMEWAQSIQNATLRKETLTKAAEIWRRKDNESILKWLNDSNLDPATRALLERDE